LGSGVVGWGPGPLAQPPKPQTPIPKPQKKNIIFFFAK